MNELERDRFERRLSALARGLDYPRTPDIAGAVMRHLAGGRRPRLVSRKVAWALTALLILCSSLMVIPPARAAIIEFIQIGVVRIFGPRSTPPAPVENLPSTIPATATPGPTSLPLIPVLENLAGEMPIEQAQQSVDYPILLPSYPPGLGSPDHALVQEADGPMTVLIWLDPEHPGEVSMSLHFIPSGSWAVEKISPVIVKETSVNGQRAAWTVGPYPLRLSNGDIQLVRLIDGHVLIWAEGDMTYRLETGLPLEEALKVAESLQPISEP